MENIHKSLTIYGTLSEEEGMKRLKALDDRVDLILIGGRYTAAQRARILAWKKEHLPYIPISQPGYDYPYANEAIYNDVYAKLHLL